MATSIDKLSREGFLRRSLRSLDKGRLAAEKKNQWPVVASLHKQMLATRNELDAHLEAERLKALAAADDAPPPTEDEVVADFQRDWEDLPERIKDRLRAIVLEDA